MEAILVLLAGAIGAFAAWGGAHIANNGADRRLKIQLDHDAAQREKDRVRAIRNDSLEPLASFINIMTETIPAFIAETGSIEDLNVDDFNRWISAAQRARVSLLEIEDNDVLAEFDRTGALIRKMVNATDVAIGAAVIPETLNSLAVLRRHYTRLKSE